MNIFGSCLFTVTGLFFLSPVWASESVDPDNDGSQYAYASNLGWINAEPLGNGGSGLMLSGSAVSGWLWSANSGWISLSCTNTDSCSEVNYGVNYTNGQLNGYGWSPNLGWISFSCLDSSTCGSVDYSVSVDSESGEMAGYAYAANAGWIGFSCSNSASCNSVDYDVVVKIEEILNLLFEDGFEG